MFFRKRKQEERPSVDWMDFEQADGGPTRRMVDRGVREMASKRDVPLDATGDEVRHLR